MESIAEQIEFLKAQRLFHERKATASRTAPSRIEMHNKLAARFTDVIDRLGALGDGSNEGLEGAAAPDTDDLFAIDRYDLSALPDSLVEELSISRADEDDTRIVQLLRIARRPLNINELMVGLYRKFNTQYKRTALNSRLYRMANKGDIESAGKGLYQLPAHPSAAQDLFSDEEGQE
jgi:hypothetical protein